MKVLYSVAVEGQNPFLKTLTDAIRETEPSLDLSFGSEHFWNDDIWGYDIFHIMWPEALLHGGYTASQLEDRILKLRERGVKIVTTCHNLEPHYCNDADRLQSNIIAYRHSDVIQHMGQYSANVIRGKYPNARHDIIPHHIYDALYKVRPSKEEACKRLNLDSSKRYVLSLGAIRDEEEVGLLKECAKQLAGSNIVIIAPSLMLNKGRRRQICTRLKYYFRKYIRPYRNLVCNIGFVDEKDIPLYFAVSDVSLIQRTRILNSGNLTLGMYAGNVVVGPNTGNVGELLSATDNVVFDTGKLETIPECIRKAFEKHDNGYGEKNMQYAMEHWNSHRVARMIVESYSR